MEGAIQAEDLGNQGGGGKESANRSPTHRLLRPP